MRALSDPDAFLPSDAGVLHALAQLGTLTDHRAKAAGQAESIAESWRPWRSYAVQHLLAFLEEKGH